MAELRKRVGSLKRELEVAQDMKPAELAGLRRTFITQDIVTANSQIEKMVLASQLARLSVPGPTPSGPAAGAADAAAPSDGNPATRATPSSPDGSPRNPAAADPVDTRAAPAEQRPAAPAQGDAAQVAQRPTGTGHGNPSHLAHNLHRHVAAAVAGAVSSTHHELGRNVRHVDLQA